jgi:hypothetical protein
MPAAERDVKQVRLALKTLRALKQQALLRERAIEAGDRKTRLERGRSDLAWFLSYYLGHWYTAAFGAFHVELMGDFRRAATALDGVAGGVQSDGATTDEAVAGRSVAVAFPRDHGKTTVLSGLILWAICTGLRRFILLVGATGNEASDRLTDLRRELEQNERLRDDYGDLVGTERWSGGDLVTRNGVRVRATSVGAKLRGTKRGAARPDLAVLDDIEDDEQVLTEYQRGKVRAWLTRVLIPALDSDRGVAFVLGTILHADSLLARLVGDEYFPGWTKRLYRATPEEPLWAARWPTEKLATMKASIGSVAFSCEFENRATSEADALFRQAWLDQCRLPGVAFAGSWGDIVARCGGRAPLIVVHGWDFGWVDDRRKAQERDSNYTAYVGVAVDPVTRHRQILRVWRDRGLAPSEVRAAIRREAAVLAPPDATACAFVRVAVESVGLQKQLYQVGLQAESDLCVVGVLTGADKGDLYRGVPGLSARFEGRQYGVPWPEDEDQRGMVQALLTELHGLGREAHDDMVMALWFTEVVISRILAWIDRHGLPVGSEDEEHDDGDGNGRGNGGNGGGRGGWDVSIGERVPLGAGAGGD